MEFFNALISFAIMAMGIYCIVAAIKMKRTGIINKTILIGRNTNEDKCKDKLAYLSKAIPTVLVFGIVAVLYGTQDILVRYVLVQNVAYETVSLVSTLIFLAVLIWFMIRTGKLRKEYF